MNARKLLFSICLLFLVASQSNAQETAYEFATEGSRYLEFAGGAFSFKILVEEANLGSDEIEIAETSFAPGYNGSAHAHGSTEIFYVLSGEFEHTVNGETALLTPGMVGIVRAGDEVIHRVPSEITPAKVLIIWTPGGEVSRALGGATERAIN